MASVHGCGRSRRESISIHFKGLEIIHLLQTNQINQTTGKLLGLLGVYFLTGRCRSFPHRYIHSTFCLFKLVIYHHFPYSLLIFRRLPHAFHTLVALVRLLPHGPHQPSHLVLSRFLPLSCFCSFWGQATHQGCGLSRHYMVSLPSAFSLLFISLLRHLIFSKSYVFNHLSQHPLMSSHSWKVCSFGHCV